MEESKGHVDDLVDCEEGMFSVNPLSFCDHLHSSCNITTPGIDILKSRLMQCENCVVSHQLNMCAKCFTVHCGRGASGHALEHARETGHLVISLPRDSFIVHINL